MKIVFCGGGTGGHITPALAMADILRQKYKNAEFAFVGRTGGAENAAIEREGHRLYTLELRGLKRSLSPKNVTALTKAVGARRKAKAILTKERPDAVIGTGGYVSWPVLSAARSLGIPTAIHESNAYPGVVTRYYGRRCDLVMLGYPEAESALRGRCQVTVTGNPVRSRVGSLPRGYARARLGIPETAFVILSFGGSLGASRLNGSIAEMIAGYSSAKDGVVHIHATGRGEYEKYASLDGASGRCRVLPYIEDMPLFLAAADVGITRCGAMTLAELCTTGLPSILLPSPNVTADHQRKNAAALAATGGAVMIEEGELTAERLTREVESLRSSPAVRERMRASLRRRSGEFAAPRILAAVESIITKK